MAAPRTVYIAGAGIAGLTLALGLAKFGLQVVVLERNRSISEFGAGLQISPNAHKPLASLGLSEALAEKSFVPKGIDIFPDGRDAPLQTLVLGDEIARAFGAPYAVMHRADLVEILAQAAKRFANIDIVFGVENFSATQETGGVLVTATEPDGRERRAKAFAFIGADGVRSATRTDLLGGPAAIASGKIAWRALVDPASLSQVLDLSKTTLMLGGDFHLVVYPLPHRDAVNLALFTPGTDNSLQLPRLDTRNNGRLAKILAAAGERWTPWVLASVETATWSKGAIGLIGDAAHAMLPFQAQGAAMGIEDAATLAPLLAASPNAEHALARFEALRRERVTRVQQVSASNGRIFHMRWPLCLARNAVIKASGPKDHFRRLDWLYAHEIGSPT